VLFLLCNSLIAIRLWLCLFLLFGDSSHASPILSLVPFSFLGRLFQIVPFIDFLFVSGALTPPPIFQPFLFRPLFLGSGAFFSLKQLGDPPPSRFISCPAIPPPFACTGSSAVLRVSYSPSSISSFFAFFFLSLSVPPPSGADRSNGWAMRFIFASMSGWTCWCGFLCRTFPIALSVGSFLLFFFSPPSAPPPRSNPLALLF